MSRPGLPAVRADAFDHLRGLADGTLDGIFSSQFVEHLSPERIFELLGLCAARLARAGIIVIETVNPLCPSALGAFFLNPTHVRPVPPGMLRFMLEQHGFEIRCVTFSAPVPESGAAEVLELPTEASPAVTAYRDYAVVALKR